MSKPDVSPSLDGHRQRLRRRMEREGWDALRPHEMVEIVLNYAVPRQDASGVARALVDRFGSVGGVFTAGREQLLAVNGVTPRLAEWIGVTGELMRAYFDLNAERDIRMSCFREVQAFLTPRLDGAARPALWVVYADFDFNLITYTDFGAAGDAPDADIARRMLMEAVSVGARYVYLVRLDDVPREVDGASLAWIEAVATALRAIDVDMVDCVLAGNGAPRSLRTEGMMTPPQSDRRLLALHEAYVGKREKELWLPRGI